MPLNILYKTLLFRNYITIILFITFISFSEDSNCQSSNSDIFQPVYITDTLENRISPYTQSIILGNYLISLNYNKSNLFLVHNKNNKRFIGRFGKEDDFKNPNKLSDIQIGRNCFYIKDDKYLYEVTFQAKASSINYKVKSLFKFPIKKKVHVDWADIINDSLFIYCISDCISNSIYYGTNKTKFKKNKVLPIKQSINNVNEVKNEIILKPDKKRIALLPSYNTNTITIISKSGQIIKQKQIKFLKDFKDGYLTLHYTKICATNQYIYAVYNNLTQRLGEHEFINQGVSEIHIWDWDANLLKKIKSPCIVRSLAIEQDDSKIYCITADSNNSIVYEIKPNVSNF